MFTPGQVSEMLEIPPSTLRRYLKQFETHLSESATKKRGRRFSEGEVGLAVMKGWIGPHREKGVIGGYNPAQSSKLRSPS
jgi:hypothetical protein